MIFTLFYLYAPTFAVLNCQLVLFIVEFKCPKREISFYAFIINNKVLLYLYLDTQAYSDVTKRLCKNVLPMFVKITIPNLKATRPTVL